MLAISRTQLNIKLVTYVGTDLSQVNVHIRSISRVFRLIHLSLEFFLCSLSTALVNADATEDLIRKWIILAFITVRRVSLSM